ncbi:L-xylulose reductase [Orchesella cincta]|uniref:L-xylulose reductase n=1 Tax=Orchesella cincta TaxID=48709 RepID=A0A1D2M4L5_ORCCI|nr:L-xylulose reductase [Orchesella cincta]
MSKRSSREPNRGPQNDCKGKCGAIVNIGSISGKTCVSKSGVYCTTKAALDMLTKVMAVELGSHNITVNSVTPAMVDTDLIRNGLIPKDAKVANVLTDEFTKGFETFMASRSIATSPYIEMKDIVNAVLFLASGENRQISGTDLSVDAGFLIM